MGTKHLQAVSILLGVVALLCTSCDKKVRAAAEAPPDVEVAEVVQRNVPITREWVATLDGLINAQIHAQVAGYLVKQNYVNGAFVHKGTPLFQIDPRPFQAALDQAKANVEQGNGTLKQAEATLAQARADQLKAEAALGKTQIDVTRYTPLAKESAISQQELDDAIQANLGAKAQVEATKAAVTNAIAAIGTAKASILGAQAALETAKLNLGFTSIVSPVDGVASIATAQLGDLVGPQSGTLTTVSTVNPILVNFTPSEQEYLNVAKQIGGSPGSADEALKKLEFKLVLANGSDYPETGRIYAVNRQVDIRTGTILVQTEFPNPGDVLRPGGFGRVHTVVKIQQGALLVPQISVIDIQGQYLMAVVDSDNKVNMRPVKAGPKVGQMWVIDSGLRPGERVVAEGVQKVREGMQVNPKPYQSSSQAKQTES
ncbi:MAG: efflux RND transporter periplasmic adaptor subunit [Acidobacteriaceae bacterium]|nr:efflux RND transporter periplasmic adaptor subunit [Acidobacteriaceae bacterium]